MNKNKVDLMIIGAGPVGLMSAFLAHKSGLTFKIIDKNDGPLKVGRADALNARTLQLLQIAGLFNEMYPLGKTCNTSSIWEDGKFKSRESKWWDNLEGCFHKHFLMLGQSHLERILDKKLNDLGTPVSRKTEALDIVISNNDCHTHLSSGEEVISKYVIAADGPRSFVRNFFKVDFNITRPELTWAVIDGIIDSDFPKVPEIIVFQAETSDVAWIPREGEIDRFYVRMDKDFFTQDEVVSKINRAMSPHTLKFKSIEWFSKFSVKESVAEKFVINEKVFLLGDACHIHSVNGGQGLNTGLADAFNLVWKLAQVIKYNAPQSLLTTFESERLPVAQSVIVTSGELVRSTKFSSTNTHADDYLKIVEKRAGNITGMGIRYGDDPIIGTRLHDSEVIQNGIKKSLYSLLDYDHATLIVLNEKSIPSNLPSNIKILKDIPLEIFSEQQMDYLFVRPDGYIGDLRAII